MEEKQNKTSAAQLKAVERYNKKKKLIVIGCKVTNSQKDEILCKVKEKGYPSINAYLKALIGKDLGIEL